ncbi:DUF397 domain-containing protein [Streptomyces hainanensis]|uniref:DUF397 domain-containing protein n=1 Tax=Streptomyces hainanensis TaxID=402648 RepID=A0A4R4SYD5_9ACTN|nr:DUF397 domain-containing protein [Streptomyces hainanensis]TDC69277.1 DUF397 domain-containing protein [Streptomyces hainanensis]
MDLVKWQKSSFSGQASNCVNLAAVSSGTVWMRESDDPAVVLATTPAALSGLLAAIRMGCLPATSAREIG